MTDEQLVDALYDEAMEFGAETYRRKGRAPDGKRLLNARSALIARMGEKNAEIERFRQLRPVVRWFAEAMERKLRANDHKGGWRRDLPSALLERIKEETEELANLKPLMLACVVRADECPQSPDHRATGFERVVDEAADVANFAMMIADVCACPVLARAQVKP